MPTSLTDLTLAAARDGLRNKDFTAVELTEAHIAAVEAARPLNAYITETPERALQMAKASDGRLAKGEGGTMEGLPVAIKDLFCTEGVQTTAASHILDGFTPPYESTVTRNLWEAGAVMLGKTNLDEFAMGSSNITSHLRSGAQSAAAEWKDWQRTWCPAARPAVRPQRSPAKALRWPPPAPIPADRSVSRRRFAGIVGHQAHLWPVFEVRHHRVCLARSIRPVR